MSEIKVNKISPRTTCGTTTLGDSGDTFTLPSGATMTIASGATITNSGTAAGFGGTGEISWDTTVKTNSDSGFTATAGIGYFLNTTGGTITVNLPAGVAGNSVAFADYAGTWQTDNVTISPNGSEKIGGVAADVTLSTEGQSVQFVYIDGTQGWVNVIDSTSNVRGNAYMIATGGCISTCGNCKMHTFLSPGTFTVCTAAICAANNVVSYMVIAGGGGGGFCMGGAGGAGGYRELKNPVTPYTASPLDGYPSAPNRITVSATAYPIIVGGGGAGSSGPGSPPSPRGVSGDNSSFSTIVSAGGGGGGSRGGSPGPTPTYFGLAGGSGGGGSNDSPPANYNAAGNTPPVSPPQGNQGGYGRGNTGQNRSGGGGGATAAGGDGTGPAPSPTMGPGGAGATSSITGSPVGRAGGGSGGRYAGPGSQNAGTASDGGGAGGPGATDGATNSGGGGGGAGHPSDGGTQNGGAGGSGIVVIRYRYQ